MSNQSSIDTVVLIVDSGSGESATTRSGHYSDLPYNEVWWIHICMSRYTLTCYPLNRTHVHTIYVTCEFGISAILCLHRHSSAPLACWRDSVHHRMAVSSSSIVMFVSTSYKQYEMRDLEFGYQWSTTTDLNYKEQYKVQWASVQCQEWTELAITRVLKCVGMDSSLCALCVHSLHYCCDCTCIQSQVYTSLGSTLYMIFSFVQPELCSVLQSWDWHIFGILRLCKIQVCAEHNNYISSPNPVPRQTLCRKSTSF